MYSDTSDRQKAKARWHSAHSKLTHAQHVANRPRGWRKKLNQLVLAEREAYDEYRLG